MNRFWIVLLSWWLATSAAAADETVSFKDKTITMIVASSSGGGTDTSGRLIALLLANSLPGKPTVATTDFPEALAVDDMGRLYASCRTGDLYTSDDAGDSWRRTDIRVPAITSIIFAAA